MQLRSRWNRDQAGRRGSAGWPARHRSGLIGVLSAFVAATCFAQQRPAAENEAPSVWRISTGMRAWSAQWDSWNVGRLATGVAVGDSRYEVVESRRGNERLAVIPVLSVRRDAMYLSLGGMTKTSYTLNEAATPNSFDVRASRREVDLNMGYSFAPGLAASLGAKEVRQSFGPDEYKWSGPVLGGSASAPLGFGGWGLYGSLGLGRLRGTFPNLDRTKPTSFNADYRLADLGITYSFLSPARGVRALIVTFGYRAQRVATRNYPLAVTPSGVGAEPQQNAIGTLVDTTQGFVLGFQEVF